MTKANYILFDDFSRVQLLPFTFTRPVAEIRFGILTIKEKWEQQLGASVSYHTQPYLRQRFKSHTGADTIYINGKICPSPALLGAIHELKPGSGLARERELIAFRTAEDTAFHEEDFLQASSQSDIKYLALNHVWDIFSKNAQAIVQDFEWLTKDRSSQPLSSSNTVIGDYDQVFLEEGAVVEACTLNTKSGPIYIGKHAELMENTVIRGPFSIGEHSVMKLASKVYGATTIGPHCKVGGEVSNSVIFGYSNKSHDGFLGNSVLGEWCNLGADTNNSNLKNNYGPVKLYNYGTHKAENTGLQFCGLMMGDHSKCGINTMFNTGTVVGVGANIFGGGFPPTHVPSFSWGGAEGFEVYKLDKMYETADRVLARRQLSLSDADKAVLKEVYEQTKESRVNHAGA